MIVKLYYKTIDTPAGKINVRRNITMKEADGFFRENKQKIIRAYVKYSDGWHYTFRKVYK